CIERGWVQGDVVLLTKRMLRLLAMFLRCKEPSYFDGQTWPIFQAHLLSTAAKIVYPSNRPPDNPVPFPLLSKWNDYQIQTVYKPFEKVGGDWVAIDALGSESLWILVADVCGKSWPAYLLAKGLSHLWRFRLSQLAPDEREPKVLLELLNRDLEGCLPEAV